MAMFPGLQGSRAPFTWSTNRLELVNHYKGWPFVAIRAIAEEIAGMAPQLAYRRDGREAHHAKRAAMRVKGLARRKALAEVDGRYPYLPAHLRAKALATVQMHEELEPVSSNHPLLKLWNEPNSIDTAWSLSYKIDMFQNLCGTAYLWTVPNGYHEPAELWVLPSHWLWPKPGPRDIVAEYEVRPIAGYAPVELGVGWFMGGSGFTTLPADQIIRIEYPNPLSPFDGYSPMIATSEWTQTGESIDSSRVAHFTNGMFPGVAIEIDKEVEAPPSQAEIDRIKTQFAIKYGGVRHTNEPVVLAPGVKLVPWTKTTSEMDYVGSADQVKTWLLAAHRTPPSIVGLSEESTFAGLIASKAAFHQNTIKPKLVHRGQVLTRFLASRWDPDLIFYYPDSIPDDPDHKLRKWDTAMQRGAATQNEFRTHVLDMEPFENGGDDPILPNTMSMMPVNTGEEYEDTILPALAALDQENKEKEAEGALERGEGALERGDAAEGKGRRTALGETPQESPGDKARNRLSSMRAHVNGKAYR